MSDTGTQSSLTQFKRIYENKNVVCHIIRKLWADVYCVFLSGFFPKGV